MNNREYGRIGEKIATEYLRKKGWTIIAQNYNTKVGEIDIIAIDSDYLVFIEVKARNDISKGYPREAVTKYKQNRIRKAALMFIAQNKKENAKCRFDVIEILNGNIEHIVNAF
ncbi:MAG: YraN family protein [Firmicutes bacterium]|nr:YraN family protein [Bacillota bacterium]